MYTAIVVIMMVGVVWQWEFAKCMAMFAAVNQYMSTILTSESGGPFD